MIELLLKQAPVVGQAYGLTKTAMRMYNCTIRLIQFQQLKLRHCLSLKNVLLLKLSIQLNAASLQHNQLSLLQLVAIPGLLRWRLDLLDRLLNNIERLLKWKLLKVSKRNFLKKLIDSKLVKHVNLSDVMSNIDSRVLNDLISRPLALQQLMQDHQVWYSLKIIAMKLNVLILELVFQLMVSGQQLSSKIPSVTFDVEQGGNLRKTEEAECAYYCCIVYLVLKDQDFKTELEEVIKNYDFVKMTSLSGKKNFKDLLAEWQDLQSIVINVSISTMSKRKVAFNE